MVGWIRLYMDIWNVIIILHRNPQQQTTHSDSDGVVMTKLEELSTELGFVYLSFLKCNSSKQNCNEPKISQHVLTITWQECRGNHEYSKWVYCS
jgi:hypothetical protein